METNVDSAAATVIDLDRPGPVAVAANSGLSFANLTLSITKNNGDKRYLLNGVSGECKTGFITAIAGQSGAGKSTLLDVLSGRISMSKLESGLITANGVPVGPDFRLRTGYVMQDDALFPLLTVDETFYFTARLRLPADFTAEQRQERVDQVINELGLAKSRNTIIGDETNRGISGGEKRRVSIGQEMIRQPSIMFLDEPTSGLDSRTAFNVIQMLRSIARGGRCVVLTIHQPSSRLLEMLDHCIVLSAGQLIFNDETSQLVPYFTSLGHPQARMANSLEFALDLAEDDTDLNAAEKGAVHLIQAYEEHNKRRASVGAPALVRDKEVERFTYNTSAYEELRTLLRRSMLNTIRTKELFFVRLSTFVTIGVLIGTLFLDLGHTYQDTRLFASYVAFINAAFIFTSAEALPIYLMERTIFKRETSRGAYRPSTYAIATFITAMPFHLILSLAVTIVTFFLLGLTGAGRFFFQVFMTWTILLAAGNYVVMFSALVPNFVSGNTIATATFAVFFLFNGFFIPRENIQDDSPWWIWLHYTSIFKYAFEGLMKNIFWYTDTLYDCPPSSAPGCFLTGDDVIRSYGMDDTSRMAQALILILFAIFFRTVFWLILVYKNRQS